MIDYRILPEQKLIVICNWGKTAVEDIEKFSKDLRSDPHFSQSYNSIIDTTQIEHSYTPDNMYKLSTPRIDTSKPTGKVAVIAASDITFGMSRMYEIISEAKSSLKINVFRDIGPALKWLDREGFDYESIYREIMEK